MSDESLPTEARTPAWTIQPVGVEEVRPLRQRYLRPGAAPEAVVYRTDDDATAQHVAARLATGEVVGVGSLHAENRIAGIAPYGLPGMRVRGIAVDEAWRGKGVGSQVLRAMVRIGRTMGMREVWANARTSSLGFYRSARFKPVSSVFEIPGIGEHVVVARVLDKGSKKAKRSPNAKRSPTA